MDWIGGPVHIAARCTELKVAAPLGSLSYESVPCMNHFSVKESYTEASRPREIVEGNFVTRSDNNEVSLWWEDRRFMDMMERGIHRNDWGNWEMPIPFCSRDVCMPNNRSQALRCLNSLQCSFKRKPQLQQHYLEFMAKVFEGGPFRFPTELPARPFPATRGTSLTSGSTTQRGPTK